MRRAFGYKTVGRNTLKGAMRLDPRAHAFDFSRTSFELSFFGRAWGGQLTRKMQTPRFFFIDVDDSRPRDHSYKHNSSCVGFFNQISSYLRFNVRLIAFCIVDSGPTAFFG